MTEERKKRTGGRAGRIAARKKGLSVDQRPVWPGLEGGAYRPLTADDQQRIHETVLDILEQVGMADAIPSCVERVTAAGGFLNDAGRLCFPRSLVEDILAKACRGFVLHGRAPNRDLQITGKHVHFGTAGAAVNFIDFETAKYRPTELADLYDVYRLIDTLENIHFVLRPLVARDMPDDASLDLNTAYAGLIGTTKPIGLSFTQPDTVKTVISMFDLVLGGEGRFSEQPFCHTSNCFVVPPLRFAEDACRCLEVQVENNFPILLLAAGQTGATTPASLAGAIAQTCAECLAGLVYANLIRPGCRAILGPWPLLLDLRSGAMSGGSGEQAILMAACAQMGTDFYGLPTSVAASMSDSKVPDAQSGYEKGYTTVLAAMAGATMIHESAGMQASLLGSSFESFVIDNEMLGAVLRTVRGVEVTEETLSLHTIKEVTAGPNHYLQHERTLAVMEKDFVYPELGDRTSPDEWEAAGSTDIRQRAHDKVRSILTSHYPDHIDADLDARIRQRFDIRLPRALMSPGGGRWAA